MTFKPVDPYRRSFGRAGRVVVGWGQEDMTHASAIAYVVRWFIDATIALCAACCAKHIAPCARAAYCARDNARS